MRNAPETLEDYDDLIDRIEAILNSGEYDAELGAFLDRLHDERSELERRIQRRERRSA